MADETLQRIDFSELVALDDFAGTHPLKVDLVYAKASHPHNMFREAIYRPEAKMWGHRDMVRIILRAANICYEQTGWLFEVKDCLRPVEAQERMRETDIVKAHPQWLEEPNRLLSPPGKGGHPRGMAVDIILIDKNGETIDMGTHFDFLTEDRANNPAARDYPKLSDAVRHHRAVLENAMMRAAQERGHALLPLPQEWWDFRFPYEYSNRFAPIRNADLPAEMRMMEVS